MKPQLLVYALLLVAAALPRAASAKSQFTDAETVTIHYEAGSPSVDGYEVARIDVEYKFGECFGTVDLLYRLRPDTLSVNRYYWFRGERYSVESMTPPQVFSVEFEGRVTGRGPNLHFSTTADSRGTGCPTTDVRLGKFSDYWEKGASEEDRLAAMKTLHVATASAGFTAPPLRHPAFERHLAERLQQAAWEKKQQEQRAEEAARKAQEEQERQAAEQKKQEEQKESSSSGAIVMSGGEDDEDTGDNSGDSASDDPEHEERLRTIESNSRAAAREQVQREQEEQRQMEEGLAATGRLMEGATDAIDAINAAVPNWIDVELSYRIVTAFADGTASGPVLDVRGGGIFFLHAGISTFTAPVVTKYLPDGSGYRGMPLVDGKGMSNTFLELGGGVAIPATPSLMIRVLDLGLGPTFINVPEIPGFIPAQSHVALGYAVGAGLNYRPTSSGLVLGFALRMQNFAYARELDGPLPLEVRGGPDVGMSLALSAMWRFDL